MSVYATLIMWTNLSPYPNFYKEEKIKSQSNLSKVWENLNIIYRKIVIQFTGHLIMPQIVERACEIVLFLIAAN